VHAHRPTRIGIIPEVGSGRRRGLRLSAATALTLLVLAAMVGCAGKTTPSSSGSSGSSTAGVSVKIVTNPATTGAYDPPTVTVQAGQTVTWNNQDTTAIPHTVTSDGGTFDSGTLNQGKTFSHTYTTAGTFPYHCTIHPQMHGTVVVQ